MRDAILGPMGGLALEHLELHVEGSWEEEPPQSVRYYFPAIQLAALTSLSFTGSERMHGYLGSGLLQQMPNLRNLELTVMAKDEWDETTWDETTTDALRSALLSSLTAIGGQLRSLMLNLCDVRGADGLPCEDGLLADVLPLVPNIRRLTFGESAPAILGPASPPLVHLRALHVYHGSAIQRPAEYSSGLLLDLLTPASMLGPMDGRSQPHEKTPSLRELGFRSHDFSSRYHPDSRSAALLATARALKDKGVTLVDRDGLSFPGV